MGRSQYKIYETAYPYFITSSFVTNLPLFADPDVAQIVLDSLIHIQNEREVTLFAYVLMENHFHVIALGDELSEKIRHFKSFTATEIVKLFQQKKRTRILRHLKRAKLKYKKESRYQIWQEGFFPKQIIGDKMMCQKMEYIHYNPVKRGYVDCPEDWRYSSARNYASMKSLIPVTLYSG